MIYLCIYKYKVLSEDKKKKKKLKITILMPSSFYLLFIFLILSIFEILRHVCYKVIRIPPLQFQEDSATCLPLGYKK